MIFEPPHRYTNRKEKSSYVWLKYRKILVGHVLDVGADAGYLKPHLPADVRYTTIGLEPHHHIRANFERRLPLAANSFDCVLSLDVLEHVEGIHQLFDELCRVTRKYLIVSLPNPWSDFMRMLRNGYYSENLPMKFYNLPLDPPTDRHRWFFSPTEAKRLITLRGQRNKMTVLHIDQMGLSGTRKAVYRLLLPLIIHKSIRGDDLLGDTSWAVLEKLRST